MRLARLVCAVLALSMVAWATASFACDDSKSTGAKASAASTGSGKVSATAASSASGTCSAAMAAKCTPEMAAACKASMAAGGPDLCTGKKASATAAVAASNGDACCMGQTRATAVAASAHGTCPVTGATAASARGACPSGVSATAAGSSCAAKGAKVTAANGGQCTGHGMAAMAAASSHADCDACSDMADCSGALDAAGAHRQTVRLKNGIMYVYTADSPRNVSAVQAAVAHRVDRMARLASAGDKAHLCDECKAMRGAMASGKLNREVINIEGGSLTLVTSTDPTVVARLHAMADDKVATRVKL